jgi:hypothetical protein
MKTSTHSKRLPRIAWTAAVVALLAAVFAAYLSPHTVMDLATRVWSCF